MFMMSRSHARRRTTARFRRAAAGLVKAMSCGPQPAYPFFWVDAAKRKSCRVGTTGPLP